VTAHLLDNTIWHALGTTHAEFGQVHGGARRYQQDVSSLCAVRDPADPSCWADLASLVPPRTSAGLLLWSVPDVGPTLRIRRSVPLIQMVHARGGDLPQPARQLPHRPLTVADADDVLALVKLTQPGPMARRTVDLGLYLGVHDGDGRLIAMAGERCRIPGWTEISAVCTHPEHRGRGLARDLMLLVIRQVVAREDTPFLHLAATNIAARQLYESLGFSIRRTGEYVMVTPQDDIA
jgi:GNAT superfamily N-acetyltransferase